MLNIENTIADLIAESQGCEEYQMAVYPATGHWVAKIVDALAPQYPIFYGESEVHLSAIGADPHEAIKNLDKVCLEA